MENLGRYIIRASFSQERMIYMPEETKGIYQSKDGKKEKAFDAPRMDRRHVFSCTKQGRTDSQILRLL
mgnify:CR=1 FL=1